MTEAIEYVTPKDLILEKKVNNASIEVLALGNLGIALQENATI